ncbi:MAG TPA: spermidine/putrescine ABC transporter substrate-binding protein [Thermoflexia bacterium]|jgi:spermidine/putrescine-binding protein|nr:spermidine/putrescine ABC transporter substrate-binding protein [Thermoflexia bacterium]
MKGIRVIGLLVLVGSLTASLVACGGKGGGEEQALASELHVYNWSEYIDPQVYEDFEAEFGVRVIEDTFANNEELLAKLQAGAGGYDIIVPSDYMVAIMIEEGLLAELNHDNLPNLSNLDPKFANPPYDPGLVHCVPYLWGTTGIGYNMEVFEEPPDSWAYMFDPELASQYAGKFTMLNDMRETIGAALKYLGYSLNSTDEAELMEARDLLIQQKQWVYAYDAEQYEDLLSADETVMAHAWSGDIFMAAEEDERLWYAIPREGATIWADNLCIPTTAPSKYTAEVFINYLLRPDVAAKNSNYTWYASPNAAATEYIDAEILEEPAIYPPPDVMERLEWMEDLGDATPLWERIWTEVRAAATP